MDLTGEWKNQLGSVVTLTQVEDGKLEGTYQTEVSSKGDPLPPTPLHGSYQITENGVLFGFVCQWNFQKDNEVKYSSTAWSGRGMKENPNELKATWLLTSGNEPDWKSVNINQDVFTRV